MILTCLLKKEEDVLGIGTISQFSTEDGVPLVEDMNSFKETAVPGFNKHVASFQSTYALVTCHRVVPSYSQAQDLDGLYFIQNGKNQKVYLKDVVTGALSCCGADSVIGPGIESALLNHLRDKCQIGMDFTILFFRDGIIDTLNLTQVVLNTRGDMRFCIASYKEAGQLLSMKTASDVDLVRCDSDFMSDVMQQISTDDGNARSGVVVYVLSKDGELSKTNAYLQKLYLEEDLRNNRPKTLCDQMDIYGAIQHFRYYVPAAVDVLPGSPILYEEADGNYHWIGMHVYAESLSDKMPIMCTGVSMFSIGQLLQGGPVPILTLLDTYPEARRLWVDKYTHLLMPYLETAEFCLGDRVEILYILVKNHCQGGRQILDIIEKDTEKIKKAFMNLLSAILRPFKYKKHDIAALVKSGGGVLDKPGQVQELRAGITNIIRGLKCFIAHPGTQDSAVESSFECFNALLNFNFQDLVMTAFGKDGFDMLTKLKESDRVKSDKIQSLYWEIKWKKAKKEISVLNARVKELEQQQATDSPEPVIV